ncbi:hypothetical protein D5038_11935 [Verminephrobacter aporrectodeae subsp. tuberculatae]|uniref:hypothetical protein n=1 Tax=Verminephrobacter aporrectodeae TaxID=1110389 RepID=UPI0022371D12|nr:hypothetical protein [Verminephrobacter aporrectodeae]MCW5257037.1 hypothetical protein [Verminephrobacter aporrectodeae subsp. tuberculatae]
MTEQNTIANEQGAPPSKAWVRFLRAYGPTPNNLTMFDEHVPGAVGRAKVQPIALSTPMLESMQDHVASGKPGSMLIAGTAGDGKTYHCRALWTSMGGDLRAWAAKGNIKEHRLADGRLAVFIKDLSEFNGEESDAPLARLEKSVLGGDDTEIVILAANHGQVLDRLRDLGRRQGRKHPLRKPLQEFFLQAGQEPERLAVFDLSRSVDRIALEEVVAAVAKHAEWNNCAKCSLKSDGKVCPIYENRQRLLGAGDGAQLRRRLGDLVEIARLNGQHLPVRDLLALCANMILGHRDAKDGLMSCAEVARIQEQGAVDRGSVYGNAFGANLPKRRLADRPVFKVMAAFGVGDETTNDADGLLVYGKDDAELAPTFNRLIGSDPIYGATPRLLSAQDKYLEGEEAARVDSGAAGFMDLLQEQRRRLFFTLPPAEEGYPFWSMTVYRFAGEYLEMRAALLDKRAVAETVRGRLVRGLNRVMTGLLIDNVDRIFVASSGGFTHSRVSVLCDTEAPSRRSNGVGMTVKLDAKTGRPSLDVSLAQGAGNSVVFDLTPVRFEFLSRVAEGALPGSFSNECLEDMLAFKAKLLRKAELIRGQSQHDDDEEAAADIGSLTLNFIDIEQGGHGFSRPITVRISE